MLVAGMLVISTRRVLLFAFGEDGTIELRTEADWQEVERLRLGMAALSLAIVTHEDQFDFHVRNRELLEPFFKWVYRFACACMPACLPLLT